MSAATARAVLGTEDEARVQHIAHTTADMNEGIMAYLERREPNFTGH